MKSSLPSHALQHGMVLVICLIMLLLLTLSGIAAIQGSALQEKMAGNSRDSEQAFLAAEAALRNGEALIVTTSEGDFTTTGTEGLYDVTASDALPVDWKSSTTQWRDGNSLGSFT
ncbi:MAG: PilX N-terminal domain-containing pilus assembly protein, partial [Aeromonadaceae bacterium]